MECLHSVQIRTKSCHVLPNHDTVGVYDPRYDQPYPQNVSNKLKIVSRFPKIVSRLNTTRNYALCHENRDTLHKSCHDCDFPTIINWKTLYNTYECELDDNIVKLMSEIIKASIPTKYIFRKRLGILIRVIKVHSKISPQASPKDESCEHISCCHQIKIVITIFLL